MYLVAIAWVYVVLMAAVVEALGSGGTVLGGLFTFTLWGVLPLAIVLYLLRTPARRRERQRQARASVASAVLDPDGGSHPAGHAVTPKGEEP